MHWTIYQPSIVVAHFRNLLLIASCLWQFGAASATARQTSLEQKLQLRVNAKWQDQQLGTALDRLARVGEIDLWIDRRVDRQRRVSAEIANLTLDEAIREVCRAESLGIATLDTLVYVGPTHTSRQISSLSEAARAPLSSLPKSLRNRWLQSQPTNWTKLSEPKELVASWLDDAGLSLAGGEQIPHDLWPEKSLPALPLIDRLVITLAGFDLTCRVAPDGKSVTVTPMEPSTTEAAQAIEPTPSRRRIEPQASPRPSRQVFTLRLENQPLGRVVDHFAKQLSIEFVWPAQGEAEMRNRLVSCDVVKANLDELLEAVLEKTNLQHRLQGKQVILQGRP